MNVTIQVPAYQEGRQLTETLLQINDQIAPEWADFTLESWVTLSPDDRELCDTWQAAMEAEGVDVYEAPKGKLSARNEAHNHAVDQGADVIVQWDADAPPHDDNVLQALLEPLETDGDVVAVNGNPLVTRDLLAPAVNIGGRVEDHLRPHIHGQLSAFTSYAWDQVGPFDDSIDQTDIKQVRETEEFGFYESLSELGDVSRAPAARVENDPRRWWCRLSEVAPGVESGTYCARRGNETFSPRRPD